MEKRTTKGYKHSEETKAKIRLVKSSGGITKEEAKRRSRERSNELQRRQRKTVIVALGGKCVSCGFADERALQIDHIHGGGTKERQNRDFVGSFNIHVLKSFLNGENKYQLLCANCNWIKRFENNEHKKYVIIEVIKDQNSR